MGSRTVKQSRSVTGLHRSCYNHDEMRSRERDRLCMCGSDVGSSHTRPRNVMPTPYLRPASRAPRAHRMTTLAR
eukprot:2956767-Lingulodinium_polyedra.AAC.1